MRRVLAGMLAGLLLATQAQAELRGKVYVVPNPEAPRAQWRRVPLAGAYVTVFWSVTVAAPAHAVTSCRYAEIARSDERGEYAMEGPNFITASLAHTSFQVYSPGLEQVNFPAGGSLATPQDITMTWSRIAPNERLSRISGATDPGCPGLGRKVNDPRGLLVAYHRSLLEEARTLPADSGLTREYLRGIEAAFKRASGGDKPGPLRAVIVPAPGALQSQQLPPGGGEAAGARP